MNYLKLCVIHVIFFLTFFCIYSYAKDSGTLSEKKRIFMEHNSRSELLRRLFEIDAIQEGEFKLASGLMSPIYIDLRRIISFPDVYQHVVDLLWHEMEDSSVDHVGGVPYAALPLASGIALLYQKSMLMPRKEIKEHGAGRTIEGVYAAGDTVILVEDVVTSGASILRAIDALEKEGLIVKEVVAFMDREQGAAQKLKDRGIALRAVCTLTSAMDALRDAGKIDQDAVARVAAFIQEHQF